MEEANIQKKPKKKGARLSVERIYQRKTQVEHVLLRPDTYIGSVEFLTQSMWVYDGEQSSMVLREISIVPGLYKIFDEILVNAADNKQRDKNMDCIKVTINPENNMISIWNNGKGIPVVHHEKEKMFVPSLIFGCMLTSSNYNDDEKKVTGGRNGFGAKLCNIFSTSFTVETSSRETKSRFKQTWKNNMALASEPEVGNNNTEDFTRVEFHPDLAKFRMEVLDNDMVSLMSRRAYDIAGSSKGVKVFLNGKLLPVKGFKDYIEQCLAGKVNEEGQPLKSVYENVSDRWEVGLTQSNAGFQQISFVNSIATTKGGRHVDHVVDQIVAKLGEAVKKRNKSATQVKPFHIKNHLWVFINCLIENPTFDSQTKENMTLSIKSFGSTCKLSDKFFSQVMKCGIVESIMTWVNFKAQTQLNKKCHATKHSKLKGIPKLEDANDAGSKNSMNCTLILTEGDSAKTLAVTGLSVVGRDKYGVFPLRGKMLNVREASHKQILENSEINNVIKIMGLQYQKTYKSEEDLRSLRYGRLMIMTDQDQDGSHIKGLLINFIHHNWPGLLRQPFLEEFITPIVKATKGARELCFYSLPEFEEWKNETPRWNAWKIKYYKGLGTSTSKEAKEYFNDMVRHRIVFKYQGTEDDNAIQLAFSKKMIDQRKDWLTSGMEERRRRRELGLPELYLYGKDTASITFKDFVNKELILFSNMDNERSIPSVVDGLKPGQRKVIFTCLKRNDKREVKVAQLAGSVAEHSAYHHGEVSLMSTIINLAQNYVGSNNINLLQPIGQFGTRLQGGKDSASPRYIFTMLSPLAKIILNPLDQPLLNNLYEDNQRIEPEYYVPILPLVLVNGTEGIGTGWSTKIPNYNPREIVTNIRRMLAGEEPLPMLPWFKHFRGTIEPLEHQRFVVSGEVSIIGEEQLEITELPVRTWTQAYKEAVLEVLLQGTDKSPAVITDYKEYNTDTTVRFVVIMPKDKLASSEEQGLHRLFKLQTTLNTSSMVLFDQNGCLKKYESPEEILKEFFTLRLTFYDRRKIYLVGMLKAEALLLSNQARFVLEKCEGTLVIENRRKTEMIKTLVDKGYDSDPVKAWKQCTEKNDVQGSGDVQENEEERDEEDGLESDNVSGSPQYDYLLGMPLWSLTKERKDELLKKRDLKKSELNTLQKKSPSDLWEEDLTQFLEELDRVEEKEREDELAGLVDKKTKSSKQAYDKKKAPKKKQEKEPSSVVPPPGRRVQPKIDPEMKKKVKEGNKKPRTQTVKMADSDPEPAPLANRIESSPGNVSKILNMKAKKQPKLKPTQSSSQKKVQKTKKNPSSDDTNTESSDTSVNYIFTGSAIAPTSTITRPRRAGTAKKTYAYDSDESDTEINASLLANSKRLKINPLDEPIISMDNKSKTEETKGKDQQDEKRRRGFAEAKGLLLSSDSEIDSLKSKPKKVKTTKGNSAMLTDNLSASTSVSVAVNDKNPNISNSTVVPFGVRNRSYTGRNTRLRISSSDSEASLETDLVFKKGSVKAKAPTGVSSRANKKITGTRKSRKNPETTKVPLPGKKTAREELSKDQVVAKIKQTQNSAKRRAIIRMSSSEGE